MADRHEPVERDYFTDPSVLGDPYAYFGEMFAKCPVHQLTSRDVMLVTGYEESLEVLRNSRDFSSVNAVVGAGVELPFEIKGDDISDEIVARRHEVRAGDSLVTYDDAQHSAVRSLLNRLFVPSRLKANEAYMLDLADKMVLAAVAKGGCELMSEIATPFATLVVADLLGVPEDDRDDFMKVLDLAAPPGAMHAPDPDAVHPMEYMARFFVRYIEERRAAPGDDILSELANATFPDGSTPDLMEMVRLSTFLFGAGQDTSAKLLANVLRYLVDTPGLQAKVRADRALIPDVVEEVLRLEGSSKVTFRVARRTTTVGGREVPAGKRVIVGLSGGNRDPRRWENPDAFELGRQRVKEHLSFGRGPHACAGAPLARAELRIMIDRMLEHTSDIRIDADRHGPPGARDIAFEPSFIVRGVSELYVEMT